MPTLTSTDITVALQRAICCSGDLAHKVAKEYSYGLKCAKWHLQDLKLLHMYIELLQDYPVIGSATVATGTASISGTNGTIKLRVNGADISEAVTFSVSLANTAGLLEDSVNDFTSAPFNYTAVHMLGTSTITVSAPSGSDDTPNNYLITAVTTGDMGLNGATSTLKMAGGRAVIIDGDGCITEVQALDILEGISRICQICLAPPGVTYK